MKASATRLPVFVGALLAIGLVAGCGPSGESGAAQGGGASAGSVTSGGNGTPAASGLSSLASAAASSMSSLASAAAAAGLPTSTAGLGDGSGVDVKVCAAVKADVAAITRNVSDPKTFPGQCAFGGGATTVSFDVNDPRHSGVIDVLGTSGTTVSGVGDHAVWDDNGGITVPALGAWKGSVSCLVQPDSDIKNDTVSYTGKPPFTQISVAAGAAYATKMGKVCNDVFAAAG